MKTNLKVIILLAVLQTVLSQDQYFINYDCHECIHHGGKQCLLKNDWTYALCCHPDPSQQSNFCKNNQQNMYCGDSESITNLALQHFLCAAEASSANTGPICPNK